jgi:hypothetical protein
MMRAMKRGITLGIAGAVLAIAGAAHAGTKTWIGTGYPANWSVATNWQGGVAPQPGDHLSFPTAISAANDIGPMTLDGIDASAAVQIGGFPLAFTNARPIILSNASADVFIGNDVTFAPDTTVTSTAKSLTFDGLLTLSGGTFRILAPDTIVRFTSLQVIETFPTSLDVQANSMQAGGFGFQLSGDFSFTGNSIDISSTDLGLGSTPARIQASSIAFNNNNIVRPLHIVAPPGGTTTLKLSDFVASDIDLDGGTVILQSSLTMFGRLQGSAHLVVDKLAYLELSNVSTLTGGITVAAQGTLVAGNSLSLPQTGAIVVHGRFDISYSSSIVESFQCDGGTYVGYAGRPLHVSKAVSLDNCAVTLVVDTHQTAAEPVYTLVANDGPSPVTGTFAALPEGAPLSLNADPAQALFRVTYRGGDGNDIVAFLAGQDPGPSHKRNLRFEPATYSGAAGTNIPASVIATDENGAPVAGEAINIQTACNAFNCPLVFEDKAVITDASGRAAFQIVASAQGGQHSVIATDVSPNVLSQPVLAPVTITGNYQDMWWTASENGWGLSIIQHGDQLFCVAFVYDSNGLPTWWVVPNGSWDSVHDTWQGQAYTPKGSAYYAYQSQAFDPGKIVGLMTIRFFGADSVIFEFATHTTGLNTIRTSKTLTRQPFGQPAGAVRGGFGDMWWGGPNQNGWGIAVMQQGSVIFPIWYTYDTYGVARWYVVPVGTFTSPNVFDGRAYKTTSTPWFGTAYDPTKLQASDVGSFRLNFNGDSAALDYVVEGHSGSAALVKQPF